MAKRVKKAKTQAEIDQIEADRIAAHEEIKREDLGENVVEFKPDPEPIVGSNVTVGEFDDNSGDEIPEPEEPGEEKVSVSIVKDKFKEKYIANANALGLKTKAAKRSNWDWLSQQLATFCLNDKGKIDIGSFTDVLDANGVDHSKWTNKNKGWEGRFRMTGRVALQKVVANKGWLAWPGNAEPTEVPEEFRERYKTKA